MKTLMKICFLALLLILVGNSTTQAQSVKPEDVSNAWKKMTAMVIGNAEKMPAEHYSYIPIEPLAPFGKLASHVGGANYLFGPVVNAPQTERKSWNEASKDEVIENLKISFKYIQDAIDNLEQDDLDEEVEWFGSKMSRVLAILSMTDHLEREQGKVITYLRLKGVEPVRSAGW